MALTTHTQITKISHSIMVIDALNWKYFYVSIKRAKQQIGFQLK